MTNFRDGDLVRCKEGHEFRSGEPLHIVREVVNGKQVSFYGESFWVHKDHLVLVNKYPNPPHKHRDLIIEWADGAEIQVIYDGKWVDQTHPDWENSLKYRVKPQKTEKDLEIEAIQKQIDELKERLEKLKG